MAFWASFPFIFLSCLLRGARGATPTSCQKWSVLPLFHIKNLAGPGPASFSKFWPFGPSFPFILAFWAFIFFHFGLLGLHFLSFWPFGPSFGLLGLHFLSFWPFGPSFPFILSFWAFFPFPSGLLRGARGVPPHIAFVPYKEFSRARPGFIFQILAFWTLISFHFGLLGLHFLSFWPFKLHLAFWGFISFHFGLLGLHFLSFWPFGPSFALLGFHFLSFWPFGPSFPFILAFWAFICPFGLSCPFILAFWAFIFFHFGLLGLHFLSFWPFGPSFALLGFHFLSFWPFGPSFPFILAFWAFISFHCGLSGLLRGVPPTSCQKWLVFLMSHIKNLTAPGPALFAIFGLLGLHFLLFWPFWALLLCFRLLGLLFLFRTEPLADTGRPKSKPLAHQTWRKFRKTANGQTKVQTYGPPNLEKIACLRQQRRKNRQRADQSPNPWATKPGENCTLTATMSTRPPTGRPKPNLDLAVDLL